MPDETLERWAPRLADELGDVPRDLQRLRSTEAERLADTLARTAQRGHTGRLRRSFEAKGPDVTSSVDYAEVASTGGTIVAKVHGNLVVPVKPGYTPGPGYVTVRARNGSLIVVRSGTHELWAVRRREVRVTGSRYLERGLAKHLEHADERAASVLPGVD